MPTRIPSGTPTANCGRNCTLQRSYTIDKLFRHRSELILRVRSPHPTREALVTQASSSSNGSSNRVGNGKTLISSNNGVVLDRKGGSLEDRILSGEFSNQGSTKEKLLRPVRQALAKDPLGPGTYKQSCYAGTVHRVCTTLHYPARPELHCPALHCTALHCTTLHCTVYLSHFVHAADEIMQGLRSMLFSQSS